MTSDRVLVVMHRGPIRWRFVELTANQLLRPKFPPKSYSYLLSLTNIAVCARALFLLFTRVECPKSRRSRCDDRSCSTEATRRCKELYFQRALSTSKAGQIKDTSHGLKLMTIGIDLQSRNTEAQ